MQDKPWFAVVRGILIIILFYFFWILFFAGMNPTESETDFEPFTGASFICALFSYFVILLIVQYNRVVRLKEEIFASFHAIEIKVSHAEKMMELLQELTRKNSNHELSDRETLAELNNQFSNDYRSVTGASDDYDSSARVSESELQESADQNLRDLINQMKEAEIQVMNQRLYHNDVISRYNKEIRAMPFAIFRAKLGFVAKKYM